MAMSYKVLGVAAISAALLIAQGPGFGSRRGGHLQNGTSPGGMDNRLERLAVVLSLDEAQKVKAEAIFNAARESAAALQPSIVETRENLREAVQANAGNIDELAASLGALMGQMHAIHAKATAQFRAILNAGQQEQFDGLHGRSFGRRGHGRGGMGMDCMGGAGTATT